MPDDLRGKLEDAAKAGARSLHAEIVARLQNTFAPADASDLGCAIEEMVLITCENEGIDRMAALERLVAKGYAGETSSPVFIFYSQPGMTVTEIQTALREAELVATSAV